MSLKQLTEMLGKSTDDPSWKSFVQKLPIQENDASWLTFPLEGVCFTIYEKKIDQFEIALDSNYPDSTDFRREILSSLPYRICVGDLRHDVLRKATRIPEARGYRVIGNYQFEWYTYAEGIHRYCFYFNKERDDVVQNLQVSFINEAELANSIQEREDIRKNIAIYTDRINKSPSSACYLDLASEYWQLMDFSLTEQYFKTAVEVASGESPAASVKSRIEYAFFLCAELRLTEGLRQLLYCRPLLAESKMMESVNGQRCLKGIEYLVQRLQLSNSEIDRLTH